jgi:hypothetical protein
MDAVPDALKFSLLVSKWKRGDLDYLGVEYQYDKFHKVRIPVDNMPPELVTCDFPFAPSDL